MSPDVPERSALTWPPCDCPRSDCPYRKETVRDGLTCSTPVYATDSPTLTRLRARVHEDYQRRQRFGPLGRTL